MHECASIPLVIPAFRPPAALIDVVRDVGLNDPGGLVQPIVVVDDGSGPESRDVFAAVAASPRAIVVRRDANGGQGAALKTGIARSFDERPVIVGAQPCGREETDEVAQRVGEESRASRAATSRFFGHLWLDPVSGRGPSGNLAAPVPFWSVAR
ncbi:MAG: glycosyltransferase [Planctomycetota bacterium]